MELVIYTAVTILLWLLSATLLLPLLVLLKFSKAYEDKWCSWLCVNVFGSLYIVTLRKMRIRAFDHLKEHLKGRKKKRPLEILEIGIGDGPNLRFYPENSNLTVLDIDKSSIDLFEENCKKYPQVTHKRTVIAMAENMQELDDNIFDVVVCTYTLCSVENVRSVLKEVKRVLKPGGKFLFLEHVIYPGVSWKSILQIITSPLWKIYLVGCNLDRNNEYEIRRAGFSDTVIERRYPKDFFMYCRPQITGIATK